MSAVTPVLQRPQTLRTVSVVGGTLFHVAAEHLGDARQWTRIARLNGIVDPFLVGMVTLTLPPTAKGADSSGILTP